MSKEIKTPEEMLSKYWEGYSLQDFIKKSTIEAMEAYHSQFTLPEEVEQKIESLVKELSKQSTAPDKETPDWMEHDIRRGLIHGYQLSQQQLLEKDKEISRLNELIEQLMNGERLQVIRNSVGNYTVITKTDTPFED